MAQTFSFDVVSQVDMNEVKNAVQQAIREMTQRYDFKGSKSEIDLDAGAHELVVLGDDEFKLKAAIDILQGRLVKRGIALKALQYQKIEPAAGGMVRQKIKVQAGIDKERCKDIAKEIKSLKLRVQAQIQDQQVRVTGSKKDDLQSVIQHLKDKDYDFHLEFANYR